MEKKRKQEDISSVELKPEQMEEFKSITGVDAEIARIYLSY